MASKTRFANWVPLSLGFLHGFNPASPNREHLLPLLSRSDGWQMFYFKQLKAWLGADKLTKPKDTNADKISFFMTV
ncbi:hypothetical protein [Neisseria musculi]|uniref:hypothetical protein n=1 Tax=Neisseria musculi TaxID=1815583 RepID=UPI00164CD464|nr:hypothetical protein [Neisseria musculi]